MEDGSGALGPDEVAALPASRFRALAGTASGGFSTAPRWIRFTAVNPSSEPVSAALVFRFPMLERLDFWLEGPGGLVRSRGGLAIPEAEREISYEDGGHLLRLRLGPGERRAGLVRVVTRGAGFLGVEILGGAQHRQRERVALLARLGLGALLALIALLARYAIVSRRRVDRHALLFVAFQAGHLFIASGTLSALWELAPGPLVAAKSAIAAVSSYAGCRFIGSFLGTRSRHPRLAGALRASAWLCLASAPAVLLSATAGSTLISAVCLLALITAVVAAGEALVAGNRVIRLLLPGLTVFAAATAWYVLSLLGLVPPSPLVVLAEILGVAVTAASTLVAIVHRDWWDADAREDRLERQVAERTATLSQAVEALRTEATERMRAEERFRLAFETFPDAVSISRLEDGVFIAANPGFLRLHGLAAGQVLGKSADQLGLWSTGERSGYVAVLRRDGAIRDREVKVRLRTGAEHQLTLCSVLVQIDGVEHVLATARDVTLVRAAEAARARLEADLRQAQKLEAIGRLAAGVAHDFNNLLTAISANVGLAQDELPPGNAGLVYLQEALDTVERAAGLTRQLLAFTRRQAVAPRPVAVDELVRGMERLLARLVGDEVRLSFRLAGGLPAVRADPGQLEQVVLNLVVNARDAVTRSGQVTVETGLVDLPAGPAGGTGPHVRIAVRDDGVGMDEETRQRIFEPFFTTKPAGKGTGLGLATVYGIVQQHGGAVSVESAPGRGSTFEVLLPVHGGGHRLAAAAAAAAS
jgi:PAS domain S-box-containing protein